MAKPKPHRQRGGVKRGERGSVTSAVIDYSDDEREFLAAITRYKKATGKVFPTFTECRAVLLSLGYRKLADPGPLPR